MYFVHDRLMRKKLLKFTLECTFYLYFEKCYIFLTKYDLYVFSLMMTKYSRLFVSFHTVVLLSLISIMTVKHNNAFFY